MDGAEGAEIAAGREAGVDVRAQDLELRVGCKAGGNGLEGTR